MKTRRHTYPSPPLPVRPPAVPLPPQPAPSSSSSSASPDDLAERGLPKRRLSSPSAEGSRKRQRLSPAPATRDASTQWVASPPQPVFDMVHSHFTAEAMAVAARRQHQTGIKAEDVIPPEPLPPAGAPEQTVGGTAPESRPKATPSSLLLGKPLPESAPSVELPPLQPTAPSQGQQRQEAFENRLAQQDPAFVAAFMGHLAAIRGEEPAHQAHMLQSLIKRCRAMVPPTQGMAKQILDAVATLVYSEQVANDFALHALTKELRAFVTLCRNHHHQPIAAEVLDRLSMVETTVGQAFKGRLPPLDFNTLLRREATPEAFPGVDDPVADALLAQASGAPAGLDKLLSTATIGTPYDIALESGTLKVLGSIEDDSRNVLHQATYRHRDAGVDIIAQGFTDILPSYEEMSRASFERAKADLQAERPLEPIEVATTEDGDLVVRDGQERFAAALLMQGEVALLIDPRAEDDNFALEQGTWAGLEFGSTPSSGSPMSLGEGRGRAGSTGSAASAQDPTPTPLNPPGNAG